MLGLHTMQLYGALCCAFRHVKACKAEDMVMIPSGGAECAAVLRRACYGVLRFIMESGAKGCHAEDMMTMLPGGAECARMLCRACYGVLRFIMESGAKGCEVIVSGKLRAQRAKAMKFKDGYMIASGQPVHDFIDSAVRHVLLRQGVLGIKVKILKLRMLSCAGYEAGCRCLQEPYRRVWADNPDATWRFMS